MFLESTVAVIALGGSADRLQAEFGAESRPREAYFETARETRWHHIALANPPPPDLTEVNAKIAALQSERASLQQANVSLSAENAALSAENGTLKRDLQTFQDSTSWKLTAPLRSMKFW